MHAGQYKRIYNIAFGLVTVCTFIFLFGVSKGVISGWIEDAEYRQFQKQESFRRRPSYDELVKQGKTEQAKQGERGALHYFAVEKRIRFCKDNLGLFSMLATVLTYAATYFVVWFSACFVVRYVKSAPQKQAE